MALLQSLIPTNFSKLPSKKFQRKHQQYNKNKQLATFSRMADQLMIQQLALKAKKLSLNSISTPKPTIDS